MTPGAAADRGGARSVAQALAAVRERIPLREARLLLQHVLGVDHAALAAHPERLLSPESAQRFAALVERRAAGEPVAYLAGACEFHGLMFRVTPDVLIPRADTELLVDLGVERLRAWPRPRVLDLGTGSGCVAVALAHGVPDAEVTAADRSPAALQVARDNAARHGVALRLVESDWFAALAGGRFHLILANPPYIAAGDRHLGEGDLRFEPTAALVSGADGLDAVRLIVAQARAFLEPGGWLLFEHGYDQAAACRALLRDAGFGDIASWRDLAGIERVSGGTNISG